MAKISKYTPHITTSSVDLECRICGRSIPAGDKYWHTMKGPEHPNCLDYESKGEEIGKLNSYENLDGFQIEYLL